MISELDFLIKPLIFIAIVLMAFFLVNFMVRSNWRATAAGKLFFYAYALLTILLTLNGLTYFFQDYPVRDSARLVVYGGLVVNALVSNIVLLQRQRDGKEAVRQYLRDLNESFRTKSNSELDHIIKKLRDDYKSDPQDFLDNNKELNHD